MIKKPVKKPLTKNIKTSSKSRYVPTSKEKYMCTKHKHFFTAELVR